MNDDITTALERLGAPAPPSLLPAVLAGSGIADGFTRRETPIGPMYVAFSRDGVTAFLPAADARSFAADYEEQVGRPAVETDPPPRLAARIDRALATGRVGDLPLDLRHLPPFQQKVLRKTAEIAPGELRPYSWVAREIGNPGAVRAVGSALNKNPIPVLVPCHRVGRADGSLGRYAYGVEAKRTLLTSEGLDPDEVEAMAARGVRFVGSDSTGIFCYPTCRHARRITERHRVEFGSAGAADADGYRPCKVCRPAMAA